MLPCSDSSCGQEAAEVPVAAKNTPALDLGMHLYMLTDYKQGDLTHSVTSIKIPEGIQELSELEQKGTCTY